MHDETAHLLKTRSLLHAACNAMDRIIERDLSDFDHRERTMIGAGVYLSKALKPRSRADALRWIEAMSAGDEAWLVLHASPSGVVEATYHGHRPWAHAQEG